LSGKLGKLILVTNLLEYSQVLGVKGFFSTSATLMRDGYDAVVPVMTALANEISHFSRDLLQIVQKNMSLAVIRLLVIRDATMADNPFSRPGQLLFRYSRVFAETPHYNAKFESFEIAE
jgi:hypothetical protein